MATHMGDGGQENFTLIYYYLPEDKDELSTPNALLVTAKAEKINLAQVK